MSIERKRDCARRMEKMDVDQNSNMPISFQRRVYVCALVGVTVFLGGVLAHPFFMPEDETGLSPTQLMAIALVSSISGLTLFILAGHINGAGTLRTVGQVRRRLQLPVFGAITTDEGARYSPGFAERVVARYIPAACESLLGIATLAFFFIALTQSPLVESFASDPFGTLSTFLRK